MTIYEFSIVMLSYENLFLMVCPVLAAVETPRTEYFVSHSNAQIALIGQRVSTM